MNSGRFDKINRRIRPGTYVNVDSNTRPVVAFASRGSALIPLVNNWGPNGVIVKVEADNITAKEAELGNTVNNIPLVREALKGAGTVLVYFINKGNKATATSGDLTMTAKYGGTRGNDLKVSCTEIAGGGGFTIKVILGTEDVEEFEVADLEAAAVIESEYIVFTGADSGTLAAFASKSLTGGTNTAVTRQDITDMLDAIEDENISAIAIPFDDADIKAAAGSKAKYLRDRLGKSVQVVVANDNTADYEGIINVTNGYQLSSGEQITAVMATAYVAGITAGADELTTNTRRVVTDAEAVIGKKNNEQAEVADTSGEFFFTQEGDTVLVEYDINSLHTFTPTRSESYRKNKVIRVYDAISDTIRQTFPPAKFPNSSIGWDLMDGLGQTILQYYLDRGAIQNVNIAEDLRVNRGESSGDSVFFDVRLHAVDAAEKLYFSIITD